MEIDHEDVPKVSTDCACCMMDMSSHEASSSMGPSSQHGCVNFPNCRSHPSDSSDSANRHQTWIHSQSLSTTSTVFCADSIHNSSISSHNPSNLVMPDHRLGANDHHANQINRAEWNKNSTLDCSMLSCHDGLVTGQIPVGDCHGAVSQERRKARRKRKRRRRRRRKKGRMYGNKDVDVDMVNEIEQANPVVNCNNGNVDNDGLSVAAECSSKDILTRSLAAEVDMVSEAPSPAQSMHDLDLHRDVDIHIGDPDKAVGKVASKAVDSMDTTSTTDCNTYGTGVGKLKTSNAPSPPLPMAPVLLMLNRDFIVTSPLKDSLLLVLTLTGHSHNHNDHHHHHHQSGDKNDARALAQFPKYDVKRQILVGQFTAFSSFLHFHLGRDAMRVRTESNAGGTSTISESLSVEYFVRRFGAKDIVTEMEVEYCEFNWKKVDYICTLYGQRVGVSVTRAMSYPDPKEFSSQSAYRLLYKKLFGLVVARHGVSERHSFSRCILHVWCETRESALIMQREYDGVSQELDIADDVIMVLTVADGWHARPIFYESLLRRTKPMEVVSP